MLKRTKPGFTEIFSLLLLFLNINFIFLKNLIGIAIATPASQMRRPKNRTGVAIATLASQMRQRPDCLTILLKVNKW